MKKLSTNLILILLLTAVSGFARTASVSDVVTKALAYKALLTTTQQATLQQNFTNALAQKWSNLPCGATCRNGVQFSTLTAPQLAAALEVVAAAAGLAPNEGVAEFQQTRWADSILNASGGGNNYGVGIFFLAFLNTPSTTGAWMLQFGGHHFAVNIAFNNGVVVGVTPDFKGIEPLSFTVIGGATYAPQNQEQAGLVAMMAALTPTQLAAAKTNTTFSDIALGPNKDTQFPATRIGLRADALSTSQKALILEAMEPYLLDMDSSSAAVLRAIYAAEIDSTYIAYSGSAALNANANYVRIDGPSVWIELVCQTGIVFPSQIHYHTIWRDRKRDYGTYLASTSLAGTATSIRPLARGANHMQFSLSGNKLRVTPGERLEKASITLLDLNGKALLTWKNVSGANVELSVASLKQGSYGIRIEQKGRTFSSKFVKV